MKQPFGDLGVTQGLEQFELNLEYLQVLEKVGSGITADVFRGKYNGREVAVKQIEWSKGSMSAKHQLAFDREIGIMPGLRHHNLVHFFGVVSLQRPLRIITEFCSGGTCFDLLHNSDEVDIAWMQQYKMSVDVASAMAYLHSFNPQIIHRDLKSLNLLLSTPVTGPNDIPLVKVSDFGLSRMKDVTAGSEGVKMTRAAGTGHWMAPECFIGDKYDEKVDIYSYAMVLFEIICREIPFEDEDSSRVGARAVQGDRPDLDAVSPQCPEGLSSLMIRCWAPRPSDRLSFAQICVMLEQIRGQIPQ